MTQCEILNEFLQTIYKLRKKNDDKSNEEEMIEIKNEPFFLQVRLLEMKPKNFIVQATPFAPHEIFQIKNLREHFLYKGVDIEEIVTPNINKNIWCLEKDLRISAELKIYCILTLNDMRNVLKYGCPLPYICLSSGIYNVDTPEEFVKIINNIDDEFKKLIDFTPYVRPEYSLLRNDRIYHLKDDIKLMPQKCFSNSIHSSNK